MKNSSIPVFSSVVSALSFCTSNNHAIPIILSIELMMLSLIAIMTQIESSNATLIMTMLIIIVAEGVSGLTIMLNSTNAKGNDLIATSII